MARLKRKKRKGISKKIERKVTIKPNIKTNRIRLAGIIAGLIVLLLTIFYYGFSPIINNTISKPYQIIPEYKRYLKKVVVSLGPRDTNLHLHADFFRYLPEYTEIIVLLPENNVQPIMEIMKDQPYFRRTRFIGFQTEKFNDGRAYLIFPEKDKLVGTGQMKNLWRGSSWAQDLFEVAQRPDGQILLLISDVYKWFISSNKDTQLKVVSDNSYLGNLSSAGMEVKRLPVTFRGGNILIDEYNKRNIAIVGGDVLKLTRTVWKSSRDSTPTDKQIFKMLKKYLNLDEVLVIGKERPQPSLMFHLDQAMVFLSGGVIAIANLVGKNNADILEAKEVREVEMFLSELRSKLIEMGYKLVNIDTSIHNLLNYQSYVNGIPYVDALTGQKTYLMPVYPTDQTEYEKELIRKNTLALEALGYRVIHVPTNANKIKGGIHCLANVIE